MAYITTRLGMKLADPLTIQAFETAQVNANFLKLEEGLGVRYFTWANDTELNAQAGMVEGDYGYRRSDKLTFKYISTAWKPWSLRPTGYMPTFSGLTLGVGGVANGAYWMADGMVFARVDLTLGTSGFAVGDVYINDPPQPITPPLGNFLPVGSAGFTDITAGTAGRFLGVAVPGSPSGYRVLYLSPTSQMLALTAAAPFTWAAGDRIQVVISGATA